MWRYRLWAARTEEHGEENVRGAVETAPVDSSGGGGGGRNLHHHPGEADGKGPPLASCCSEVKDSAATALPRQWRGEYSPGEAIVAKGGGGLILVSDLYYCFYPLSL